MSGWRARVFDVREGEGRIAAQTFAVLFLMVAGHTMLETARDALFLSRLPASQLNLVYMGVAGISLVVTTGTVALTRRFGQRNTLVCTLVGAAYATTVVHHLPPTPRVVLGLYLLSGTIGAVLTPQFWTVAAQLFTVAQGRRLFGPIASGGVLGGLVGASFAAVVLTVAKVTALLPLAATLFITGALLVSTMPRDVVDSPDDGAVPTNAATRADERANGARWWGASPLVFRLGLLVAAATAALLTIDYLFKSTVARVVAPGELGSFFARYYAATNALSLLVQLALAGPLVRRLGVIGSLQVMPFLLLGGGIASIVTAAALASVLALKAVDGGLRYSLNRVAVELLYLPVPSGERARAKAFIDTVLVRVVQAVTSALLLVLAVRGFATPRTLAVLASALVAVWLLLASSLAVPYLNLFREALTDGGRAEPDGDLDLFSAGAVMEMLSSADAQQVMAGIDLLASKGHLRLVPALILRHDQPKVLVHALDLFGDSSRSDWFSLAEQLLAHPDEQVRLAAVRALAKHDVIDAIERASHDASSTVHTYAVFQLAIREVKSDLFEHPLVANIMAVPGEWGDALRIGLLSAITDSPDPRSSNVLLAFASAPARSQAAAMRRETAATMASSVARAMGTIKDPRFIPVCIEQLAHRDGREAAREALVKMGDAAFAAVSAALRDRATDRRVLLQLPMTIALFGSQAAGDLLVERLFAETVGYVRFRTLRALGSLVVAQPLVRVDRVRMEGQARINLIAHLDTLALAVALRSRGASTDETTSSVSARLLLELLHDKAEQALDRAFRFLKIAHRREDIHRVHRAVHSRDRRVRDNAVEFVNTLLSRHDQTELRQLILIATDDSEAAQRVARARHFMARFPQTFEQALGLLVRDPDESLAAVAAHHAMSLGDAGVEHDTASVLRDRPVLASIGSRFFDARTSATPSRPEPSRA